MPALGVQVKTEYMFGHCDSEFIDISHIKDIIINEAITMVSTFSLVLPILLNLFWSL